MGSYVLTHSMAPAEAAPAEARSRTPVVMRYVGSFDGRRELRDPVDSIALSFSGC